MITGDDVTIAVAVEESSGVGEARRIAAKMAARVGFNDAERGRLALVVTEAANNLVEHGGGGELLLRPLLPTPTASGIGIEVMALDRGPGMRNIAECMRDGFSTRGTPGNGLGAIERLSSTLEVFSAPGKGTALLCRIGRGDQAALGERSLQYGVVCVAKTGEEVCGDAWAVAPGPVRDMLVVLDGLGHGDEAFAAGQQGVRAFRARTAEEPQALLQSIHSALTGTRGAVGAVVAWDREQGEIRYAGAGNIGATMVPLVGRHSSFVSHSGTLGHNVHRFQEFRHKAQAQCLLVIHSDGLSSRWTLEPYPGLLLKDPSLIAGVLYRDFANRRDDVVVLVARDGRRDEP